MARQILVLPCYNEATRLQIPQVESLLASSSDLEILFVDDGSCDETPALLARLHAENPRLRVLALEQNQGKAEAVRRGLLSALADRPDWVGYADADFATPAAELTRMLLLAREMPYQVLLGSRVKLLGTDIERKAWRHYLGRVFATFASMTLNLAVYDTQCGAKFFRTTDVLARALAEPFRSRWAFDVELIGRLNVDYPQSAFAEIPLKTWHDIAGSKLKFTSMLKAGVDLIFIAIQLRRQRLRRRLTGATREVL